MELVFQHIYETVWKEVFPDFPVMPEDTFKKLFTADLRLPEPVSCSLCGTELYSGVKEYGYRKFICEKEDRSRSELDNFMKAKANVSSFEDVLTGIQDIAMFRGNRAINCDSVVASDDIYSSNLIYNSTHIFSCQNMLWCEGNKACEYLIASTGNGESSFSIRIKDSGSLSNCFDMHWCGKSSHSYFCADSYDLRDCMFCFHLRSKQYCIGNMQFEKEEYEVLKKQLLAEYFSQLNNSGAFVTVRDVG